MKDNTPDDDKHRVCTGDDTFTFRVKRKEIDMTEIGRYLISEKISLKVEHEKEYIKFTLEEPIPLIQPAAGATYSGP